MRTSTLKSRRSLAGVLFLLLVVSAGCAHRQPPESAGGPWGNTPRSDPSTWENDSIINLLDWLINR